MAFVKIENATVTRLNSKGFGVQVKEQDRGEFKGDRFTLWFKESSGLTEGDVVSVSGFLGAKTGKPWTDRDGNERTSVELSLNSPRIDSDGISGGSDTNTRSEVDTASDEGLSNWSTTDETPF